MLSFTFRRVLSRSGIFSIAQRSPTRAISSNQSFAMTVQRNLATTANDRSSDSTADSKPEPETNPKSTRRKTRSSTKTVGKDKKKKDEKTKDEKKKDKKAVTKPKGMHRSFSRIHGVHDPSRQSKLNQRPCHPRSLAMPLFNGCVIGFPLSPRSKTER